jgi:signal peptide peptidase SppA
MKGADQRAYALIRAALYDAIWAILPAKLAAIIEVVELRADGVEFGAEEIEQRIGAARGGPQARTAGGAVAVLPLYGTIVQRAGMMTDYSGGTSTELFAQQFRAVMADNTIGAVVIEVDSPGGSVDGVPELADEVYRSRGDKPIVASVNSMSASAAYWITSSCDEVCVTPSGEVGSIGVFAMHQDVSRAYDSLGVTHTFVSAGKYKTEGNPYEPLSDEARGAIQARVDDYYGMFVRAVARGRGVTPDDVRGGFGQGRVVGAREAVQMGMADRVETLPDTLARLARRRATPNGNQAALAADAPPTPVGTRATHRARQELFAAASERTAL